MNQDTQNFFDDLEEIAVAVYRTALDKGWHDQERHPLVAIALMHSEVTEAIERPMHQSDKIQGFFSLSEEAADIVIRALDDMCDRTDSVNVGVPALERLRSVLRLPFVAFVVDHVSRIAVCDNVLLEPYHTFAASCNEALANATEAWRVDDQTTALRWLSTLVHYVPCALDALSKHRADDLNFYPALKAKMEYNEGREYRHGGKSA